MLNAYYKIPKPTNEPIHTYLPGSGERASLKAELQRQASQVVEIPLIIGGKEIHTDHVQNVTMPHDHQHVLAHCSMAGEEELKMAVKAALDAKEEWENLPFEERATIFLKAAELISGPYRNLLNAATMLGQSKTVYQAEIDPACELVDFLRFNVFNAGEIFTQQPESSKGVWNRSLYRPLDGFVLAITPFNFTAIAGNLSAAPAVMGNTAVWKPATTAVLSNYYYMKILIEAGLPAGVVNFIPSRGSDVSRYVISDPNLAGIHFTGSTQVFQSMWAQVGQNISNYKAYPRLVGETGGKDFIFAHASANIDALVCAMVRGSFEYQGQKCSAASRAFIPASIWPQVKEKLLSAIEKIKVGDVQDFTNLMSAVIDRASFNNIVGFIERAKLNPDIEILCGNYDDSKGYFVYPTVLLSSTPDSEPMTREIFGPVLTVYVYPDEKFDETLRQCDEATPYALTGAIFANDRRVVVKMSKALRHAAGNFYINDKPTGAVVGQQPFGGGRASGTNDKAGSTLNLYRWVNVQVTKETLVPGKEIEYPYMQEK